LIGIADSRTGITQNGKTCALAYLLDLTRSCVVFEPLDCADERELELKKERHRLPTTTITVFVG
jgi:hypothetical protein